jgi:hypothetical protein
MKKIGLPVAILSFLLIVMSSCSTAKLPVETSDRAKTIQIPDGKALVYVFRKSSVGAAVGLSVDLNNIELETFYPKRFYLCVLDPGKYVFTGHGENTDEMILKIDSGKKYFIEVTPQMGFLIARCKLSLVDPIKGNEKVGKCKLVGLNKEARNLLNYNP